MPSLKCGGCAKFMSPVEAVKCQRCNSFYHRLCVALPLTGSLAPNWCCPECLRNVIRDNKPDTPVRGRSDAGSNTLNSDELMDTSVLNTTTLDITAENSPDLVEELRLFKVDLWTELRLIRQEFQQFRSEMTEIKECLRSSEGRLNSLETRVEALERRIDLDHQACVAAIAPLQETVSNLKSQLNTRDQELLLNDVEIAGVPESTDAYTLAKLLSSKLGIDLEERDVIHVERVSSTRRNRVEEPGSAAVARPRNIAVRFARRATRDSVLRAARVRRGLDTRDLDLGGPAQRLYVNERLTHYNAFLFRSARREGSSHGWKYIWTRDGRIFARKDDGQRSIRINCESDILKNFT